jgi:hypothetical protein
VPQELGLERGRGRINPAGTPQQRQEQYTPTTAKAFVVQPCSLVGTLSYMGRKMRSCVKEMLWLSLLNHESPQRLMT